MPDPIVAPANRRFDPDDLDLPVAVAAMDAIDEYTGERSGAGRLNLVLAHQRIAALHAYLHILTEELDKAAEEVRCECPTCMKSREGAPS